MMSYREEKETIISHFLSSLHSSSPEKVLKDLPVWFINTAKNLKYRDELDLLFQIIEILCHRLYNWVDEHLSSESYNVSEVDSVCRIFSPNGWLLQLCLKHRIDLQDRIFSSAQIINATSSPFIGTESAPPNQDSKLPIWEIPCTFFPESVQIDLNLQNHQTQIYSHHFTELSSRSFNDDKTKNTFILLDPYEFVLFSVISSLGNRTNDIFCSSDFKETPMKKSVFINYHVLETYSSLANEFVSYFLPFNSEIIQSTPDNSHKNLHTSIISSPTNSRVKFTFKSHSQTVFDFCDEKVGLGLSKLFCEFSSCFWLPKAPGSALVSAISRPGKIYFNEKDWKWNPNPKIYSGLVCFHKIVIALAASQSWKELSFIFNLDEFDFDRDTIKKISLNESVRKMVSSCEFGESILESLGLVFGSRSNCVSDMGNDDISNPKLNIELSCISLLVEIWLEYALPWSLNLTCRDFRDFNSERILSKLYQPLPDGGNHNFPPEWIFRMRYIINNPLPELYLPTLYLFFSSVVPSYDLLAIKPCTIHSYSNNSSKNDKNIHPSSLNISNSENLELNSLNSDISEKISTLNLISSDYYPGFTPSIIYYLPPAKESIESPIKRASVLSETVITRMKSAFGLKRRCGCSEGADILSILIKVISSFGYGYTKVALASVEISKNKKYFSKSNEELINHTLWSRDLIENETYNVNINTSKLNNNPPTLEVENLGEFRLLDRESRGYLSKVQEVLTLNDFENNYSSFSSYDYILPSNTSISKKFFDTTLDNFYPNHENFSKFFSSHSNTILPLLHLLLQSLSTSRLIRKKLSDALNGDKHPFQNLGLKDFNNISNNNSSKSDKNDTFIWDSFGSIIANLVDSIGLKQYISNMSTNHVDIIDFSKTYIDSAKTQFKNLSQVNDRILFLLNVTIMTFGVTPSQISFLLSTMGSNLSYEKLNTISPLPRRITSKYSKRKSSLTKSFKNMKNSYSNSETTIASKSFVTPTVDCEKLEIAESLSKKYKLLARDFLDTDLKTVGHQKYSKSEKNTFEPSSDQQYGYSFLSDIDQNPISYHENEFLYQVSRILDSQVDSILDFISHKLSISLGSDSLILGFLSFWKKNRPSFRFFASYNNIRFSIVVFVFCFIVRYIFFYS
ncbi:hypothetical protein AYI68_g2453 [Smittium mucronatum]|uniref:Uncharacterized protein n=1 Tax=Smittium mucronatum TaxID=133383 RepID=A0A1R0H2P4_9FUNG|nr:hypothetical protein AYI68_g2453 [Smittium mucronatum]